MENENLASEVKKSETITQTQSQSQAATTSACPEQQMAAQQRGGPCLLLRHGETLTIFTLSAGELLLRQGLEAQTLQVKEAAAFALAGHQRLAWALADLQQADTASQREPEVPQRKRPPTARAS